MSKDLQKELAALKSENEDIRSVNRRIIATLVRLEGKVDDLAERMATKDDISEVYRRIDGLGRKVDDMNLRWAVHEDRLARVEKRRAS